MTPKIISSFHRVGGIGSVLLVALLFIAPRQYNEVPCVDYTDDIQHALDVAQNGTTIVFPRGLICIHRTLVVPSTTQSLTLRDGAFEWGVPECTDATIFYLGGEPVCQP